MIPAPSYEHIDNLLNLESFSVGHGFASGFPSKTRTVGFILFDQNFDRSPIKDVMSNLDMLNLHSGTDIHFFLCGISQYGSNDEHAKEVGTLNGVSVYHNAKSVHSFIRAFAEQIPRWNYEYGCELILVDVKENEGRRSLNFETAVFFKIEQLIKVGVIGRPSDLLGKLIKFSRESKLSSASDFREELRRLFGINWLKGLILALFPKAVGKLARAEAALWGGSALPD